MKKTHNFACPHGLIPSCRPWGYVTATTVLFYICKRPLSLPGSLLLILCVYVISDFKKKKKSCHLKKLLKLFHGFSYFPLHLSSHCIVPFPTKPPDEPQKKMPRSPTFFCPDPHSDCGFYHCHSTGTILPKVSDQLHLLKCSIILFGLLGSSGHSYLHLSQNPLFPWV